MMQPQMGQGGVTNSVVHNPLSPPYLKGEGLPPLRIRGAGFASPMSDLKIEMGCAQLALSADVSIHAGAFAHPDAL
jgi:hypothetical protein